MFESVQSISKKSSAESNETSNQAWLMLLNGSNGGEIMNHVFLAVMVQIMQVNNNSKNISTQN